VIAYDFTPASARGLDELQTQLLVLPFFSDERPLRGPAGLVDWRLCGRLSRKLMSGYIKGIFGEKALLATPAKLRTDGLLLVGLGESSRFSTRIAEKACLLIGDALTQAKVSTAALALPGRSMGLLSAFEAMQIWLDCSDAAPDLEELSVIEEGPAHRSLDSLLDGLRRQAESPLD
jgi:hypothetical protein